MNNTHHCRFFKCSINAVCLVTHPCPTLCDPTDSNPPGSSVHGASPGKNTGVGCHALLQGIFPTQGSNPGLPHCRRIPYRLMLASSLLSWRGAANTLVPSSLPSGIRRRTARGMIRWFRVESYMFHISRIWTHFSLELGVLPISSSDICHSWTY